MENTASQMLSVSNAAMECCMACHALGCLATVWRLAAAFCSIGLDLVFIVNFAGATRICCWHEGGPRVQVKLASKFMTAASSQ